MFVQLGMAQDQASYWEAQYLDLLNRSERTIQTYEDILAEPDTCEIWNAYTKVYEKKRPVKGVYWVDAKFYCVWADKIDRDEQDLVDRHEWAHYLVENDREHFCEGEK